MMLTLKVNELSKEEQEKLKVRAHLKGFVETELNGMPKPIDTRIYVGWAGCPVYYNIDEFIFGQELKLKYLRIRKRLFGK